MTVNNRSYEHSVRAKRNGGWSTHNKYMGFRFVGLLLLSGLLAFGKTPVLLSTDVGNEVDDQWAIVYLLTNPDFEVEGIVSAQAPSLPDPSAHATYLILRDEVEGRLGLKVHPPLLEGASKPLTNRQTPAQSAGLDFLVQTARRYDSKNRLTILTIGAATDVASALLVDPEIANRIRVVAMGFSNLSSEGGKEYNVQNDPTAWQVILRSSVPVVIGSGDVCRRDLAIGYDQARQMLTPRGALGDWLWTEYKEWYFRSVKPLRVADFSKPWIIWDIITMAFVEDMTTTKELGRPVLSDDLAFTEGKKGARATWITAVDSKRLWNSFLAHWDEFASTHAIQPMDLSAVSR